MTVHESSLSPCVHAIIAAEIGYHDKAYELYLRTARLDLDNYNKDTDDGLHITSMAGTWMAIVYGFAGLRIENDRLTLRPFLPGRWKSYSFGLLFRGHRLKVQVTPLRGGDQPGGRRPLRPGGPRPALRGGGGWADSAFPIDSEFSFSMHLAA